MRDDGFLDFLKWFLPCMSIGMIVLMTVSVLCDPKSAGRANAVEFLVAWNVIWGIPGVIAVGWILYDFFVSRWEAVVNEGCDTGLLVLFCILAFLCPPFGWIFGGVGISVGKKQDSKKCQSQGLKLVLVATISFILSASSVAAFMFLAHLMTQTPA